MGGMKVSELDFLRLLPAFMRDDGAAVALSKAMNKLISEPGSRILSIRTWDKIDLMSGSELDELAWELDVDWYDSVGMGLEKKQETLKFVQQIKRKRGTKWAVEKFVIIAFGIGKVIPWFEYGGEPFGFKIQTNATLTKDGIAYFFSMINKIKSTRDHVDMIEVTRTINQTLHAGTAHLSHIKCVILDHFHETRRAYSDRHGGTATGSYSSKNSIQDNFLLTYTARVITNAGTVANSTQSRMTVVESFTNKFTKI